MVVLLKQPLKQEALTVLGRKEYWSRKARFPLFVNTGATGHPGLEEIWSEKTQKEPVPPWWQQGALHGSGAG